MVKNPKKTASMEAAKQAAVENTAQLRKEVVTHHECPMTTVLFHIACLDTLSKYRAPGSQPLLSHQLIC